MKEMFGTKFSIRLIPEPVILMFILASMMQGPIESEYVYKRYSEQKGLVYNYARKTSSCKTHLNSTDKKIQDEVQRLTSVYSIGQNLFWSSASVLSCLYYGVLSDKIGRRPIMMIVCIAAIIQIVLSLAIIKLNLPVFIFFASNFLNGLGGGYNGLYMMVYAYVADCTEVEALPMRIAVVESASMIASCTSSFFAGLSIQHFGFFVPEVMVLLFYVAALLYVLFVLKESLNLKKYSKEKTAVKLKCCEHPKRLYDIISKKRPNRRFLYHSLAVIVLAQCLLNGPISSWTLYFMNRPFCWPPLQIGEYLGTYMVTAAVGTFIGLKLLLKIFPKYLVATLSPLFNIAGYIVISLATNKAMAYAALPLRAFSRLHVPVFRATISSLVKPTEQGSIFSVASVLETLSVGIGGFVFSAIYAKLNDIGEDFHLFTIIEILLLIQMFSIIVFWVFWRKIRIGGYVPISDQECDGNDENDNSIIKKTKPGFINNEIPKSEC